MARRDDMPTPPALDPTVGIYLPPRMVEHGVQRHQHQEEQYQSDMDRDHKGHDRQQPSRANRLDRIKGKTGPRRWLHTAVVAFMRPFEQLAMMHQAMGKIKPRVLRKQIDQRRYG